MIVKPYLKITAQAHIHTSKPIVREMKSPGSHLTAFGKSDNLIGALANTDSKCNEHTAKNPGHNNPAAAPDIILLRASSIISMQTPPCKVSGQIPCVYALLVLILYGAKIIQKLFCACHTGRKTVFLPVFHTEHNCHRRSLGHGIYPV